MQDFFNYELSITNYELCSAYKNYHQLIITKQFLSPLHLIRNS